MEDLDRMKAGQLMLRLGKPRASSDFGGEYMSVESSRGQFPIGDGVQNEGRTYWEVDESEQSSVLLKYCEAARDDQAPFMYEILSETGPLTETFTFMYEVHENDTLNWEGMTPKFLLTLAWIFQEAITTCYVVEDPNQLLVVVQESEPIEIVENGQRYSKTVCRLQFPYVRTDFSFYYDTVRRYIVKCFIRENIYAELQRQPTGDWSTIMSKPNPRVKNLYGTPLLDGSLLSVAYIWSQIDPNNLEDVAANTDYLVTPDQCLEVCYHQHLSQEAGLEERVVESGAGQCEDYYPIYLSNDYMSGTVAIRTDCLDREKSRQEFDLVKYVAHCDDLSFPDHFALCEMFCSMINPGRFRNREDWIMIGQALGNACKREPRGLNKWALFTKSAVGGDPPLFMTEIDGIDQTLRHYYNLIPEQAITFRTLARFAMADCPEDYARWNKSWVIAGLLATTGQTEVDIAQGIWRTIFMDHMHTGTNSWFKFMGNRWIEDDSNIELRSSLVNASGMIGSLCHQISEAVEKCQDPKTKELALARRLKLVEIARKLKTDTDMRRIVRALDMNFHLADAGQMFDSNFSLLGVANGVIHLDDVKATFRAGMSEDYIRKTCPTAYRTDYTWKSKMVVDLMTWMEQMFPDEDIRHFALKYLASLLRGGNPDKLFVIFIGESNAGKSTFVNLIETVFGTMAFKYPSDYFSASKPSSGEGPSPVANQAVGALFGSADEPPEGMDANEIKSATGNERKFSRGMRENGGSRKIKHKIMFSANDLGRVKGIDAAFILRMLLLPGDGKYSHNAPKDPEEQKRTNHYPIDTRFSDKLPNLAQALLWVMVQYYPTYCAEGLPRTPRMQEMVRAFVARTDPYTRFMTDIIHPSDSSSTLLVSKAYKEFKRWYPTMYDAKSIPNVDTFTGTMESKRFLGPAENGRWSGVDIYIEPEEEAEY